jgi:hypothetical protein
LSVVGSPHTTELPLKELEWSLITPPADSICANWAGVISMHSVPLDAEQSKSDNSTRSSTIRPQTLKVILGEKEFWEVMNIIPPTSRNPAAETTTMATTTAETAEMTKKRKHTAALIVSTILSGVLVYLRGEKKTLHGVDVSDDLYIMVLLGSVTSAYTVPAKVLESQEDIAPTTIINRLSEENRKLEDEFGRSRNAEITMLGGFERRGGADAGFGRGGCLWVSSGLVFATVRYCFKPL